MIGALSGTIIAINRNPMLLDVGGVGYAVSIPDRLFSTLKKNKPLSLFVHTHVRDDAIDLFGFSTQDELLLFELLITVSGIGPKTAILVVNRGVDHIRKAIAHADVEFFTSVPRLGKKNAQKIIIELKSKIGSFTDLDLSSDDTGETATLIEALLSMGFARSEAIDAIKKLPPQIQTVEEKVRFALKLLGKP